jgi:hypothetical protein
MCGSNFDYCTPAIVSGGVQNGGPLYRAGSILNDSSSQYDNYFNDTIIHDNDCVDCDNSTDLEYEYQNRTNNTDYQENTTSPNLPTNKGWQGTDIGIPTNQPNQNYNPETPKPTEITPPKPKTTPRTITPQINQNTNEFTIENLKQLDPSINDPDIKEVRIINIEDNSRF